MNFKATDRPVAEVNCVVVGGPANGRILQKVRVDAKSFELRGGKHLKPMANPHQVGPDIGYEEKAIYDFHPLNLIDSQDKRNNLYGIAVLQGMRLSEGFNAIVTAFVEKQLMADAEGNKQ